MIDADTIRSHPDAQRIALSLLSGEPSWRGKRAWFCCPLHQEKTPSFMIDEQGGFYCYGCSRGGSVIDLVMAIRNVEFLEASKWLGNELGIARESGYAPRPRPVRRTQLDGAPILAQLEEWKKANRKYLSDPSDNLKITAREQMRHWMPLFTWSEAARDLNFPAESNLPINALRRSITDPPYERPVEGQEEVYAYLDRVAKGYAKYRPPLVGREALRDTVTTFGLGCAKHVTSPKPSTSFDVALAQRGIDVGVLMKDSEDRVWPRFNGHLTIPIRDIEGRVIAIAGRALHGQQPKYINTHTSPIWKKSHVLYNLDRARKAARTKGQIIVVEGYFDVIKLAQHGIENVVAIMGTSLSEEQARLLAGFGDVVLMLDGDMAGYKAALKAFPTLLHAGAWPRVVCLPEDLDPDSFIEKHGVDVLAMLIHEASPLMREWWGALPPNGRQDACFRLLDGLTDPFLVVALDRWFTAQDERVRVVEWPKLSVGGFALKGCGK